MKKILLVGRSGAGKTTLTQALKGKKITYHKTQYVNHFDVIIDTPGEYAETKNLAGALALFSYEADVVGLLINAAEPYSIYPPNIAPCVNREMIGIVTQIDRSDADPEQAETWLRLTGCEKIFHISAVTGQGVADILQYLKEDGDVMPWEKNEPVIQ
jgi:ethanolamine utilization protein EutP